MALVERAAAMLASRKPVTLRTLVEGTGASTMAVYTHFGGMPGLWRAVRQEGFTRLTSHLAAVPTSDDPVRDLMALAAAYLRNAQTAPDLYRAMFDDAAELADVEAAAETFGALVQGVSRARDSGRFARDCDPQAIATQLWAAGHGTILLVLARTLPDSALDLVPATATALFVAAGDEPAMCGRSVRAGWNHATKLPWGSQGTDRPTRR